MEKHGGTIEISSVVNEGTAVRVCFPPSRTFDFESEPSLICTDFGCKPALCQPSLQNNAVSPCRAVSMQ